MLAWIIAVTKPQEGGGWGAGRWLCKNTAYPFGFVGSQLPPSTTPHHNKKEFIFFIFLISRNWLNLAHINGKRKKYSNLH
jgi:hypothetical protein